MVNTLKNATKQNFDCTIVDRLRTVSWSNNSHSTQRTQEKSVVINPCLKDSNLPTHRKVVQSIVHGKIEILFITQTDFNKDGYMLKANQE